MQQLPSQEPEENQQLGGAGVLMVVGRELLLLQLLRGKPLLPAEVGVLLEGGQRLSGSS